MSRGAKDNPFKDGDVGPLGKMAVDSETLCEALSREGFEPATVGRRIVSKGKPRETLK